MQVNQLFRIKYLGKLGILNYEVGAAHFLYFREARLSLI